MLHAAGYYNFAEWVRAAPNGDPSLLHGSGEQSKGDSTINTYVFHRSRLRSCRDLAD